MSDIKWTEIPVASAECEAAKLQPALEHQLIAKALNNMFIEAQNEGIEPHQIGTIRIWNVNRGKGAPRYIASAPVRKIVMGVGQMEDVRS